MTWHAFDDARRQHDVIALVANVDPIERARAQAASLPCWRGPVEPVLIEGGMTNLNFRVDDQADTYFVRVASDIPLHQILRSNEAAAQQAAACVGLAPPVVAVLPGLMVTRFINGRCLTSEEIRNPTTLNVIVELIRRCHHDVPDHLRGPITTVWPPYVVRDYAKQIAADESPHRARLPAWLAANTRIEEGIGEIALVFGHNDLLSNNFLVDAEGRLWLVDWEYSGYTSCFLDLAGLAVNNDFSDDEEIYLLDAYFGTATTVPLLRRFRAMKAASALRESFVMETHSAMTFDYQSYTAKNLARFEQSYDAFLST